jgi:hypothetical protein
MHTLVKYMKFELLVLGNRQKFILHTCTFQSKKITNEELSRNDFESALNNKKPVIF